MLCRVLKFPPLPSILKDEHRPVLWDTRGRKITEYGSQVPAGKGSVAEPAGNETVESAGDESGATDTTEVPSTAGTTPVALNNLQAIR